MNSATALADIKGYAAANRIHLSRHALERGEQRSAQYADVRAALLSASACRLAERDRWHVSGGVDLDGDELSLIVVIEDGVIVVTLF
jgi:hypothetical protein